MSGPWRSERLVYRAIEPEDESAILADVSNDAEAFMNAAPFLPIPRSKKHAVQFREYLDTMLLAAVICLPPPANAATTVPNGETSVPAQPTPIGIINLSGVDPRMIHHRRSEIGINIARQYQGQGFGTEAIKWALNWGFTYANLHRVEIGAFAYNEGAVKLYERMGFVPEGRRRDFLWHEGRFWDVCEFGMLEDEWRGRYGERRK